MKVLRVHNRYQQRGGEDSVFESEVQLLRDRGELVETLEVTNEGIVFDGSIRSSVGLAVTTIWSRMGRRLLSEAVARSQPDVVHFDNTFPLLSPASYMSARSRGAAVVQTLHNYRLICPKAVLYRDGQVCEDCVGRVVPIQGIRHSCYRGSAAQTAVVAAMLGFHRVNHTWTRGVDRYLALSEFARQKFVEGGLPENLLDVKPNFVDVEIPSQVTRGDHFLFVGRLVPEKGISTLVSAQLLYPQELRIVGDGPLRECVRSTARTQEGLTYLGHIARERVHLEMGRAMALIFPSEWYEGFPLTIVEAFACSLPVIASRLGTMAEVIEDGVTGLLFNPGDADDLAEKVGWASAHPDEMRLMGIQARRDYVAKYSPDRNYDLLMSVYDQAMIHRRAIG